MFRSQDAKKLLFSINENFPHYQSDQKLAEPIKKLHYAIKITLKKIKNIQEHINADVNPEASKTAETLRQRKILTNHSSREES